MKKIYLFSIVFTLAISPLQDCAASKRSLDDRIDAQQHKKPRVEESISIGRKDIINRVVPIFLPPEKDISENMLTYDTAYNTLKDYTQSFTDDQCYQLLTLVKHISSWMQPGNLKLLWKHYFSNETVKSLSPKSKINVLNLFKHCEEEEDDEIDHLTQSETSSDEDEDGIYHLIQSGISISNVLKENDQYFSSQEEFLIKIAKRGFDLSSYANHLDKIIQSIQNAIQLGSTYNFGVLISFQFTETGLLTETESVNYFFEVKKTASNLEGLFLDAGNYQKIHRLGLPVIQVASQQDHLKGKSIEFILDWCEQIPWKMRQSYKQTVSYLELIPESHHKGFYELQNLMTFDYDVLGYNIPAWLQQNQIQRENIFKLLDLLDSNPIRQSKVFNLIDNLFTKVYQCFQGVFPRWCWISSESGFNILKWFYKLDETNPQIKNLDDVDEFIIEKLAPSSALNFCPISLLDWLVDNFLYKESHCDMIVDFLEVLGKSIPDIYQSDKGLSFIKHCIKQLDSNPESFENTVRILKLLPNPEIFVNYLISLQNDPARDQLWLKINGFSNEKKQTTDTRETLLDYAFHLAQNPQNKNDPQFSEKFIKLLEYLEYSESNETFKTAVHYCWNSGSTNLNCIVLVLEILKLHTVEDQNMMLGRAGQLIQAFPSIPPESKLALLHQSLHKTPNFENLLQFAQKIVQNSPELEISNIPALIATLNQIPSERWEMCCTQAVKYFSYLKNDS